MPLQRVLLTRLPPSPLLSFSCRSGEDIRERYYLHEANNRRAKGMSATQGKANRYFTGEAVMVAEADR